MLGRRIPYQRVLGQDEMMPVDGGAVQSFLRVTVTDKGLAIPGALVTVEGADGKWEKKTDANGLAEFSFALALFTPLTVIADKAGYRAESIATASAAATAPVVNLALTADPRAKEPGVDPILQIAATALGAIGGGAITWHDDLPTKVIGVAGGAALGFLGAETISMIAG